MSSSVAPAPEPETRTAVRNDGLLLVPTGHEADALRAVRGRFDVDSWRTVTRAEFRGLGAGGAVRALRRFRTPCFAVYSPDLESDPDLSLLRFAALLPRAERRVLVDARGGIRELSTRSWIADGARLLIEATAAAVIVAAAWLWSALPHRRTRDRVSTRNGAALYLRHVSGTNLTVGGSHTHTAGVIGALDALGFRVHVLTNVPFVAPVCAVTTVVRQSSFPSFVREASDLLYNLRLARYAIREGHRGTVSFVYQRHTAFSVGGYLAARRLGVPLVLEYNASEAWARRHWGNARLVSLIARLERVVLRRAALVLAISEPLADELRTMGVDPRRIALAPNGVDPAIFDPDRFSEEVYALRAALGIASTQTVVGFLGTFGPWHGTMVLAQAIPLVVRVNPDVRFLVIGEGGGRAAFGSSVGAAGAAGAVIMTGAIPHRAVPEYLAACDILVSPHVPMPNGERFFGSPTKLYEYMAIGRAIVASRLEQLEQVLSHAETAVLVPAGDPSALAGGILELAADPVRARALGKAARAAACERHTWTRMTAAWLPRIGASEWVGDQNTLRNHASVTGAV